MWHNRVHMQHAVRAESGIKCLQSLLMTHSWGTHAPRAAEWLHKITDILLSLSIALIHRCVPSWPFTSLP